MTMNAESFAERRFPNRIQVLRENAAIEETYRKHIQPIIEDQGFEVDYLNALSIVLNPDDPVPGPTDPILMVNKMSPSAPSRDEQDERAHADSISIGNHCLRAIRAKGISIVNGPDNYEIEFSKARQAQLLLELRMPHPATRVISDIQNLTRAAMSIAKGREEDVGFVVKADISALGKTTVVADSIEALRGLKDATVSAGRCGLTKDGTPGMIPASLNGCYIIQEKVKSSDGHVFRAEVLGGRILYAVEVEPDAYLGACVGTASMQGRAVAVDLSPTIISDVLRIAEAAHMDMGGVEFMIDEEGRHQFIDINALSNLAFVDQLELHEAGNLAKFPGRTEPAILRGFDREGLPSRDIDPFREHAEYICTRARFAQLKASGRVTVGEGAPSKGISTLRGDAVGCCTPN